MSYGRGIDIPLPTGRRLVISDIHGCSKTLRQLLLQLRLTPEDQLFFLGDYINKGPDSLGVITIIQSLIKKEYSVFPVLGNHDQMLLDYFETKQEALVDQLNQADFLKGSLHEFELHQDFFRQLVPFYVSGDFLLVHAGFDFNQPQPFSDLESMLTIRDFQYDFRKAEGRRIVHGHHPRSLIQIQTAIRDQAYILPLDNGCVCDNREEQGNLLCLNLNTFRLWVQPNIDHQ